MTQAWDREAARSAATVQQTLEDSDARVYLRRPTAADQDEFLDLCGARASCTIPGSSRR